jgi:uroporphyrinogen III methyltransferase/synthase
MTPPRIHGKVILVGTGPGDLGLLTLRAREAIAEADVILYDHLANGAVLRWASPHCEAIYVGKSAGRHTLKQSQISALLVEHGRRGRCVVRLKGGDPYVFGRGGEEALAVVDAGLALEVVPGITSGIAAAAYAGIAVTHREHNSVLTFVTGHEMPDKHDGPSIDWHTLARTGGTLVVYMGVKNLPHIAEALIAGGRDSATPVAVIQWGTLPRQHTLIGTLADIAQKCIDANLQPPCIIIIGEVVAMRDALNWYERLPLFGQTILVTRAEAQADAMATRLTALGAAAIACPTIRFEPPRDTAPLNDALDRLNNFDWILFTSVNAVEYFFDAIYARGRDARALASCRICGIGPITQQRLADHGIRVDAVPNAFTSRALFDMLCAMSEVHGRRILLPRADIAEPDLANALIAAGAHLTEVVAYHTRAVPLSRDAIDAIVRHQVTLVTLTSGSTARYFTEQLIASTGAVPNDLKFISIGPQTTHVARSLSLNVVAEADVHTIDGLIDALIAYAARTHT